MRRILICVILGAVIFGDVYGIYPARVGKRSASDSPPPEGEFPFGLKKKFNGHVSNHGNDDLDEGSWNRGHENYGGQYPGFKKHPTTSRRQSSHGHHPNLRSDSPASQPDCRIPGNCPDTDLEFNSYSKNVRLGNRRRSHQSRNQYDRYGSNQLFNLLPPPEDEFPLGLNAKLGQQNNNNQLRRKHPDYHDAAIKRKVFDIFEILAMGTKPGEEHFLALKKFSSEIFSLELNFDAVKYGVIKRDLKDLNLLLWEYLRIDGYEFMNAHGNKFGKEWLHFVLNEIEKGLKVE